MRGITDDSHPSERTVKMTVQATFCATLVDEWARCGVTDAVVTPGSRSTPLAVALADEGRMRLHVMIDERSAGFFALGLGLASGRPPVVLTTSGTAAVELHPSVVEAHQSRVPVLVCTADRPPELHHVGAPQTVEQANLFEGAVRWAFEPGVADEQAAPSWRSVAARAVAVAATGPAGPGPVHLNLAFREPLVGLSGPLPHGRAGRKPWHVVAAGPRQAAPSLVAQLTGYNRRGVIVAGAGAGDPDLVQQAGRSLGWPVLADPRSGCRLPSSNTVAAADALLRSDAFATAHRPEVVLRLGAPWASRVVAEWLAALDVPQYLVDPDGAWLDPGRSATTVVSADPTSVCQAVVDGAPRPAPPDWLRGWRRAESAAQAALETTLAGYDELTEPAVARAVAAALPGGAALVASSSMPVRDLEWYAAPRRGVCFFANRGANGIDGVVSTALGLAAAWPGPVAALVGDLAFLYDVNGLLVPPGGPEVACTMVVVDNDGGGIFSFLPQAAELAADRFERLLATPHCLDLCAVARAHGARADEATSPVELAELVTAGQDRGGVNVVVVRTERAANVAVHGHLHQAVAEAIAVS
ncbi:MAG: 2-succinyl-5-enolpyruvyl-6-hydroxy-3-cyclohexene-1-carboxylic-acid synthase [Actinomycetota bacterium]|nr:2-succinyl-5-enolpyruvyl-6-hydroxy-3-cyclohexene-1-carboxylic-acid synthase [Actinomycetota bacterium]